jgi:hypothetical protein
MTEAERRVAQFLFESNIYWLYEQPVCVADDKGRPRIWNPDFYLPELGIYVEVCGADRSEYSFRETIYKKNRIPVIFVHVFKEEDKWKNYLVMEIKKNHEMRSTLIDTLD